MPKKLSTDKHLGARRDGVRSGRRRAAGQSAAEALESLLRRQPQWTAKAAQADENQTLLEAARRLLPDSLKTHLRGAQQQQEWLVITADSAAWSGRLRYALADQLPALQKLSPTLLKIRFRVGTGA